MIPVKVRQSFKKNRMEFYSIKVRPSSLMDFDQSFLWSFTLSKFWPSFLVQENFDSVNGTTFGNLDFEWAGAFVFHKHLIVLLKVFIEVHVVLLSHSCALLGLCSYYNLSGDRKKSYEGQSKITEIFFIWDQSFPVWVIFKVWNLLYIQLSFSVYLTCKWKGAISYHTRPRYGFTGFWENGLPEKPYII